MVHGNVTAGDRHEIFPISGGGQKSKRKKGRQNQRKSDTVTLPMIHGNVTAGDRHEIFPISGGGQKSKRKKGRQNQRKSDRRCEGDRRCEREREESHGT